MSINRLGFTLRNEGELIPEGLSITQTPIAWYVRVRDSIFGTRLVRLPKMGEYSISPDTIEDSFEDAPPRDTSSIDEFLEDHNDGY